jgi:nicotinate dehydrogenase subunit B
MDEARRQLLRGIGAIIVTFALPQMQTLGAQQPSPSLAKNPTLGGWIRIDAEGVTVCTGKAELGQGILTALAQIAAEELDVPFTSIRMVSADTAASPDERYTYGSQSIEQSGAAIRQAAAQGRALILERAALRFQVGAESLRTIDGRVLTNDGRSATYWEITREAPDLFSRPVTGEALPKSPKNYRIVGRSQRRADLPAMFFGGAAYLQDMRLPGMVYGRVVRPPRYGAKLTSRDFAATRNLSGVLAVVREGNFLGVVACREEEAIAARKQLIETATWEGTSDPLPPQGELHEAMSSWNAEDDWVVRTGQDKAPPPAGRRFEATYTRPFLSQASIGPSCAVAVFDGKRFKVWSHSQGVFPLRGDIARVMGLAEGQVDVAHVPGAGCYGQNGADDVSLDAALLARAIPDRPVKVQWMRDDEFGWAPAGPAMLIRMSAELTADGRIVDWTHDVWSNSHAMRPGQPGGVNLLAAWHLAKPFEPTPPLRIPQPYGDGDRNSVPYYALPRVSVRNHLLLKTPIRNGSLRTLGGHGNTFAIESFLDEIAQGTRLDPVQLRLAHLTDPRAASVVRAVAQKASWPGGDSRHVSGPRSGNGSRSGHGRGFAFSRYKNIGAYTAVIADVEVAFDTGEVTVPALTIAVDVGQVINPDGVINQIEGGAIQGMSITLKEEVSFDEHRITSLDWSQYPIVTFAEIPGIEVVLLDRPDEPCLGAGEASLAPVSAAIANAVASATGHRFRDLPISRRRVSEALRS